MEAEQFVILGIAWQHYVLCWVGAIILYFRLKSTNAPVVQFLPHINKRWENDPWANFFDALIFSILGAIVGTIITTPISPQQAIAAGLGWTGLLSAVGK